MRDQKSRSNKNVVKLLKQVDVSKREYLASGVPPVRPRAYQEAIVDMVFWDRPHRSNGDIRNWKRFRKTQYKL